MVSSQLVDPQLPGMHHCLRSWQRGGSTRAEEAAFQHHPVLLRGYSPSLPRLQSIVLTSRDVGRLGRSCRGGGTCCEPRIVLTEGCPWSLTRVVAWTAARVLMSDAITLDMVAVKALVRVRIFVLSKGLRGRQDESLDFGCRTKSRNPAVAVGKHGRGMSATVHAAAVQGERSRAPPETACDTPCRKGSTNGASRAAMARGKLLRRLVDGQPDRAGRPPALWEASQTELGDLLPCGRPARPSCMRALLQQMQAGTAQLTTCQGR